MRILILTQSYPPVLGGLQTVTHVLASRLQARGHSVLVVTNHYPRALARYEKREGVELRRWLFLHPPADYVSSKRLDLLLASCWYFPRTLNRLRALISHFGPDVVNLQFPDTLVPYVLKLGESRTFRLVVSLHGDEVERWRRAEPGVSRARTRFRRILQECDAVTACSRYLLDRATDLEPSVPSKGRVIHNGIDARRFATSDSCNSERRYILLLGRLTRKKGFDLLLDAFARLADRSDLDLVVAGEGEEEPTLREQARLLQIADRVRFFGRASATEVVSLLRGAQFLVVPSREEPFGIVALEALAAGTPVLVTSVGGLPELVDATSRDDRASPDEEPSEDASIQIVEPTVDAIGRGLANWYAHPPAPLDESRRKHILSSFDWGIVVTGYEEVYGV